MTRMKPISIAAVAALTCLFTTPLGAQAEAENPSLVPTFTDNSPARDVRTYADDRLLTNRCIESGRPKTECLCVTKVLKYELNVRDYRAAARLYSHPRTVINASAGTRMGLEIQGMSASEIHDVNTALRNLTSMHDFGERCAVASRYYDTPTTS